MDITVISAFAAAHGMSVASSDTAILEASPTPPPNRTNLTNEPNALPFTGRASDAPGGFGSDAICSPSRTRAEQRRVGFSIDDTVEPEQRPLRPACQRRCGRRPAPVAVSCTMPAVCLLITALLAGTAEIGAAVSNFGIMLSIGWSSFVLGGSYVRRAH
ncbi:hypothetical protein ABZV78_00925 [Micromonospora sp. NPDC004540]|uniref:hypothetical protein n=1 Tax=Micromonospora sp. NPDC004540 TaxID=3154457 RepID=UPI0033B087FF